MTHLLFRVSLTVFAFSNCFLITNSHAAQLQTGKEVKETLDSITSSYRKEYFSYDASGNNTTIISKVKDGMSNQWLYEYKAEMAYNAAGKITSSTNYKSNSGSGISLKDLKTEYSYNTAGMITSVIQYKRNSVTKNWLIYLKEVSSFNENGQRLTFKRYTQQADTTKEAILTSSLASIYNAKGLQTLSIGTTFDASGKKSYRKNTFNYDAKANVTEEIQYIAQEDSIWKQDVKVVYLYRDGNKLVNKTIYIFNEKSSLWLFFTQTTRKYDASGNEIEKVDSIVFQNQNIVELYKEHKEYNAVGKEISRVFSKNKPNESGWEYATKFETSYDNLNQLQSYSTLKWVDSLKNWVKMSKGDVIRDTHNDIVSENMFVLDSNNQWSGLWKLESKRGSVIYENTAIPLSLIDSATYRITSKLRSSWVLGNWLPPFEEVYHYSERTILGLNPSSSGKNAVISPNPAKDYFNVQKETLIESLAIELTDMQGQKVLSQDIKNNTPVSVGHLKRGIYIYRLSNNNGTTSGKLLVE